MKIAILQPSDVNDSIAQQAKDLFSQLNASIEQVNLAEMFKPENEITFAYCMDKDKLVGMALMCAYTVVSGYKGWVEDVVVDKTYRGQGLGRKLMEKLVDEGKKKGLSEILLFSNDKRVEAITLYKSLGFKQKESRIYVLKTS
ncbi:GNAT family N-acetyltransferase [Arenibacter latericius]|uniref:GNAT family N-acetyltransferase n=1 Tax=Arenibacter latericius TaxID=86104 RepID=UPI000407157F|nr:GNAT family N-acetyltransferase [Arenibacter latericius]MDX1364833.1 GNAT family N-acetyltransferase [Arenibacter latericius]